jgi:membrane protein YqaA with SNARE-associated domain
MFRGLYEWTLARCAHRHAERWLGVISFAEASVFPIPPDVLLAPMCLARPERAFRFAAITTIASVLGALAGYAIGLFLFETVGRAVLDLYGASDQFSAFAEDFNAHGWLIVFLAGFTPIPFKVVTIAAGATGMPLVILLAGSLVSRGLRFFIVAALLWRWGVPMKTFIDRHFAMLTLAFGALAVGGFVAVGLWRP